jgi:hypothetical protein
MAPGIKIGNRPCNHATLPLFVSPELTQPVFPLQGILLQISLPLVAFLARLYQFLAFNF